MPHMPDFEAWAIFAKVAERGSFSDAAQELGLAKTTVSKAVTRLEERLQTTLLHRTTRSLSLTESGRQSLDRATRILADGAAVEAELLEEAAIPRGLIRLASTTAFGMGQLAPLLPEFVKLHPEIEIDFEITDRRIDLVAEGVDLVLRVGPEPDSSLRITKLFGFRVPVVGSPAYFEKHGRPEHPTEGNLSVHVDGPFHVNNGMAAVPALVAGLGLTALPEAYVVEELNDGQLEEVLSEWPITPAVVHVITPPGRARPARVRALIDFLRGHFAAQPWARGIET